MYLFFVRYDISFSLQPSMIKYLIRSFRKNKFTANSPRFPSPVRCSLLSCGPSPRFTSLVLRPLGTVRTPHHSLLRSPWTRRFLPLSLSLKSPRLRFSTSSTGFRLSKNITFTLKMRLYASVTYQNSWPRHCTRLDTEFLMRLTTQFFPDLSSSPFRLPGESDNIIGYTLYQIHYQYFILHHPKTYINLPSP